MPSDEAMAIAEKVVPAVQCSYGMSHPYFEEIRDAVKRAIASEIDNLVESKINELVKVKP